MRRKCLSCAESAVLTHRELQNHAGQDGNGEKHQRDPEAVRLVRVAPEEDEKPEPGAGGETRHGGAEADGALGVELGGDDGGGAVGNQPHEPREKRLENASAHKEGAEGVLADELNDSAQSEHHGEDEAEGARRVAKGAL